MKRILFIFALALVLAVAACAQPFEGKIVYENKYSSKTDPGSGEQMTGLMGSKQEYFIKGGNYKSVVNGAYFNWQIYIQKDNRLYNKFSNSETIYWSDGATVVDPVLEVSHRKKAAEILGYSCDELILKGKNQTATYYFNSSLEVDAAMYSKHLYGNWYEYLNLAKAIPLKIVIHTGELTLTSTATEIKSMKLADSEFTLPQNAKFQRNPN